MDPLAFLHSPSSFQCLPLGHHKAGSCPRCLLISPLHDSPSEWQLAMLESFLLMWCDAEDKKHKNRRLGFFLYHTWKGRRERRMHAVTIWCLWSGIRAVLYFSHVSCCHTFFSEEVPSRWNQSTFFSFSSLVGKSLFKDMEGWGGSQWSWTAVGDDSVFYFDVFILLVSFPVRCSVSVLLHPTHDWTEKRETLLSSCSTTHMLTITKHKH